MARLGPEECMFDRSGPARKLTAHHGKGAPSPKLVLLSLIVILLTALVLLNNYQIYPKSVSIISFSLISNQLINPKLKTELF
jgi:hypothetical protein